MKKTMMPFASPEKRGRREGRKSAWKRASIFFPLALLMIAITMSEAGIPCSTDSQCRRDVCIKNNCASRASTNGFCSLNSHCFNAATESCIKTQCLARSAPGGDCDDAADCATQDATCSGGKCTPFDPSVMVWDGNPAPVNPAESSPSAVVKGILYVFEGYSSGVVKVEAYNPGTNSWKSLKSPSVTVTSFSVVAVGDFIFLIGGLSGTPTTTFIRYDPTSDAWDTNWDPLPEARYASAATVVGSTIFIFGGRGPSSTIIDSIRSIDVSSSSNKWQKLTATLPSPTSGLSAAAVDTDIYITGGRTSAGIVNTVLKYSTLSPNTSPTTAVLSLTQRRENHMSFFDSTNKRLYAVGYSNGVKSPDAVEYLDMTNPTGPWKSANAFNYVDTTNSISGGLIGSLFHFVSFKTHQVLDITVPSDVKWSPFRNFPSPAAYIAQLTSPTKITAVDTNTLSTSVYDITTNTWTAGGDSSKFPDSFTLNAASAVVNGELYVMGGDRLEEIVVSTVYALNKAGDTWNLMDPIPSKRTGGCAAVDGTDIYFFGGTNDVYSGPLSDLFVMDTKKTVGDGQWTTVTPVSGSPTAVMGCAAVVVGRKLLIFGGGTSTNGATTTGDVQSFDIPTKTWDSPLLNKITARSYHSAVLYKGFVFVIGGSLNGGGSPSATAKTEAFDIKTQNVKVITDVPTPRFKLGSVTDGTSIFAISGQVRKDVFFPSLEKLRVPVA